ncbi:MAG TPA: helix-turn-helix domain-containing protein [Devosia sp.]|nr:helix-turn-helix domain-containing protein [Devosia sp.]
MQLDFSIGELAAETGVKVPTIRYYEGIGLIDAPPRTSGNQRRYDRTARDRLKFIAHARAMGFPMDSLRSMLRIAGHKEAPCADLDRLVRERLDEVDERIARLTALRGELSAMLESRHHGTVGECRVVEVLSDHECCSTEH